MGSEIRIYYESFEQAKNFFQPIIQKAFPELEIKLVFLSKFLRNIEGSLISAILRFKNPDILISYVKDNEEIPLFVIELSEAVMTEDHELQRFDGYLGAVAGKCFYIKISPFKVSGNQHGGNTNFNILEPYALIYKNYGAPSFHFEWPIDSNSLVKRDKDHFSCPPNDPNLNFLVIRTIECVLDQKGPLAAIKLYQIVVPELRRSNKLSNWFVKLETTPLSEIHQNFKSSRVKWLSKEGKILFKFNRMGHAMDPERGMIWYYRERCNKPIISRIIFPSAGDKIFKEIKLIDDLDYLRAFVQGLSLENKSEFKSFLNKNRHVKRNRLVKEEIDITAYVKSNLARFNKSLFAIFVNSVGLLIQDKAGKDRVKLTWNINFNLQQANFTLKPLNIELRNSLEEDDVTYLVVHQILKPNGFKIVSVSYPGAQGDRAILPDSGTGRQQQRKYIDIISYLPEKFLDLNESKGKYSLPEILKDVAKLDSYRSNPAFDNALRQMIDRSFPEAKNLPLLLSVSFWLPNKNLDLMNFPIHGVNFFIVISPDAKKWKLWVGGDLNIFQYKEGSVDLSETYRIK